MTRVTLWRSRDVLLECFRKHLQFTRNEAGTLFDSLRAILEILEDARVRWNDENEVELRINLALSQKSMIPLWMNMDEFSVFVVTNSSLAVDEAHVLFNANWRILETTDISRIRRNPRTWAWEMACFLIMALDCCVCFFDV